MGAAHERRATFKEAGFTDVALVQIGGDQQQTFLEAAQKELLPALREALG